MRCEELRELAPDIALDMADGEERAAAMRHLEGCSECRRLVEELSQLSDELLRVAPTHEPPEGFESRVIDRLGLRKPPRRARARRALLRIGPAIAAAAATAAVLVSVYSGDRGTADSYEQTLHNANGRYFLANKIEDTSGHDCGTAFGYAGEPSWIFLTVAADHRDEVKTAELVMSDGRRVRLPGFQLGAQGSWGGAIPVRLEGVGSIRLLGEKPGDVLVGPIHDEPEPS